MEQFSLEKYLENTSRKVVTRRGNPVRIICTDRKHGEDDEPIVFLEQCNKDEFLLSCRKDGRSEIYDTPYDLFFADEEEELTNFEKELQAIISDASHWISDDGSISTYCQFGDKEIKRISAQILDLARKELEANYYTKVIDDRMVFKSELHEQSLQTAYDMGKQDALKDLPKWKKITKREQNYLAYGYLSHDEYYLSIQELKDKLPKEE